MHASGRNERIERIRKLIASSEDEDDDADDELPPICRCCLEPATELLSLYKTGVIGGRKRKPVHMLEACTCLEVSSEWGPRGVRVRW